MNNQNFKDSTINYYNDNARAFIKQTFSLDMQLLYEPFIASLPATTQSQQRILDVGCGSGRDSLYFSELGLDVTAIDASAVFIDIARKNPNQHDIEWHQLTFKEIHYKNWQERFTGIWACASLLHMSYKELPVLIDNLIDMLSSDGVFYASFKYGNSERLADKRFFCDVNEERWQAIKQKLNHDVNHVIWLTKDQRIDKNEKWFNILIKRLQT